MNTKKRVVALVLTVVFAFFAYSVQNLPIIAVAVHLEQKLTAWMVIQLFGAWLTIVLMVGAALTALVVAVKDR